MLLKPEEQKQFAALINSVIDIPWVPETMEQQIFEHALGLIDKALEDTLPTIFHGLMREAEAGIDRNHVQEFTNRLVETTNPKFDLPYLNEEQEAQILRMVISPMVKAMSEGKTLSDLLPVVQDTVTSFRPSR